MKFSLSSGMYLSLVLVMVCFAQLSSAAEPNWYPYVVARGKDRVVIKNMPMYERPYRPMHFYGNSVRRNYHRGVAAPMPRDWVRSATIVWRR